MVCSSERSRSRIRLVALITLLLFAFTACYVPFMSSDLGDATESSPQDSDPGDPGDDVEPPLFTLLADVDLGGGVVAPNFDLVLHIEMPAGFEDADIFISITAPSLGVGPTPFELHSPGSPIVVRPSVIPVVNETVTVEAYADHDGEVSVTVSESYALTYDTLSVSLAGDDSSVGSSTDPLATLGEAVNRVQSAGGAITDVRIAAGHWINAGTTTINNVSNLTIRGSYEEDFFQIGAGETRLDASGSAPNMVVIQNNSSDVLFEHLTLTGASGGANDGAGIWISAGNRITIGDGVTIRGNTTTGRGGGVAILNSDNVEIHPSVTIAENSAYDGGGVYIDGGSNHVISGEISQNIATTWGGGVSIDNGNQHLIDATIVGNRATDGGAVSSWQGTAETISGLLQNNEATDDGGGVYVYNGTGLRIDATIVENQAVRGGGIALLLGSSVEVTGLIDNNDAEDGGGVYMNAGDGHLILGEIRNNRSTTYGGGVSVDFGTGHIIDAIVQSNSSALGGGVSFYQGTDHVVSGQVADNEANQQGGGIWAQRNVNLSFSAGLRVLNNTATDLGGGIYIYGTTFGTVSTDVHVIDNSADTAGAVYNYYITTPPGQAAGEALDTTGWTITGNLPDDTVVNTN